MGSESAVIHCSGLAHQVELAQCLLAGFNHHGLPATISDSATTPASLHVVIGPWFALNQWRYSNTILIDRAYWGDPDNVSVHWLVHGEKLRTRGNPWRSHPELKPMKTGARRLYLCDYGCEPEGGYDTARRHPAEEQQQVSLADDLASHDIAIGRRTTALVDAAFAGLQIQTKDRNSPVYGIRDREQWAIDLAWHNWSKDEIRRGVMWEILSR